MSDGDFQFSIDSASDDFLKQGVFACYRPAEDRAIPPQKELSEADWIGLLTLAHTKPSEAFQRYAAYYLSTDGQVYWSDTQQLGFYPDDYHRALDARLGTAASTEVISELYVPACADRAFPSGGRRRPEGQRSPGHLRNDSPDREGPRELPALGQGAYACMVVNLHTTHTPEGIERAAAAFRGLTDRATRRGEASF